MDMIGRYCIRQYLPSDILRQSRWEINFILKKQRCKEKILDTHPEVLYDITLESEQLFKEKNKEQAADRLSDLSSQALRYAITLREAEIPEKYWLPPIMDWLLFTWYKNRNLPVSYLLKVYDDYSKKELSGFKRVKLQKELLHFQYSLKRLVSYT